MDAVITSPADWLRDHTQRADKLRRAEREAAFLDFAEEARRLAAALTRAFESWQSYVTELAEYDANVQDRQDADALTAADREYLTHLPALWHMLCNELRDSCGLTGGVSLAQRPAARRHALRSAMDAKRRELIELLRTLQIGHADKELSLPDDLRLVVWTVRIPWWAYLRSMWTMYWSAILHPLSETTIELSTGRVLYRT